MAITQERFLALGANEMLENYLHVSKQMNTKRIKKDMVKCEGKRTST